LLGKKTVSDGGTVQEKGQTNRKTATKKKNICGVNQNKPRIGGESPSMLQRNGMCAEGEDHKNVQVTVNGGEEGDLSYGQMADWV